MEKYFDIVVNPNDETGVDFNSFVDMPAHTKEFIYFGKQQRYHFNEEKRILTGVAISANTWIYRNDEVYGEHYVRFSPETIEQIRNKFFINGYGNNVNLMHDESQVIKGATLVDSYIVSNSNPNLPNVPECFKNQNIQDGSWITSYLVTDDKVWNEIKSGKFKGFSVEGWFEKKKVNIKQQHKMSKPKKNIFQILFGAEDESQAQTFAEVTAVDGTVLVYEGELGKDTVLFVKADPENTLANPGDYQVKLEDGMEYVVTVGEAGMVMDMKAVEAMEEDSVEAQVAEVMKSVLKDTHDRFNALEEKVKTLEAENEQLRKGGKFQVQPKKTSTEDKKTVADILKLNN